MQQQGKFFLVILLQTYYRYAVQAMLVLTTMLTNIANDLPRTAAIKFIDIWMLFSMTIPVMEIFLHTMRIIS